MANNFFKVDKGVTLAPQSSVASPQNGDVYYDSTRNTYVFRNNGQNTDLQKRSDVATAASLTSSDFTASVIQSSFVKLTGSTSGNIHGFVASSDAKMFVLYNASSAIMTIKNQSTTEATAGNRIVLPNSADLVLTAGKALQFSYDSTQSRWVLVSSSSGSGGSGGGSKNYLSAVTTSQSTTPNTGNGDFESGSTTGWSLGTTGTLTNGLPTGSPTFGSGASGNLSISVVSSGTLAGSYSLSYASSAATTQGNMLASDTFNIDNQDQGKVLTWKFYYKAQTNPTNANWSGTSSNSFGVAVWDVTNSQWLGTSANFAMTQSFGIGVATGSFQTNSTTTQLRLVVYNVNATSGAITLYFDDFSVGPQITSIGSFVGGLNSYTPVATNLGSGGLASAAGFWRRIGDSMQVQFYILKDATAGTGSGVVEVSLPSGYTYDTSKIAGSGVSGGRAGGVGTGHLQQSAGVVALSILAEGSGSPGSSTVRFTRPTVTGSELQGSELGANNFISGVFTVPINGWGAQSILSNDTDTRVVAASYYLTGAQSIGNSSFTTMLPTGKMVDTHAAFNTSTGTFTAPISGIYKLAAHIIWNGSAGTQTILQVSKNGSTSGVLLNGRIFDGNGTAFANLSGNLQISLNSGDTLTVQSYQTSGGNLNANSFEVHIERLSGPSVIAASESVYAAYETASGASINNSTDTTVIWNTKIQDTHGGMNTSTGIFTVPISGLYEITVTNTFNSNSTGSRYITTNQSGSVSASYRGPTMQATTTGATGTFNCSRFKCLAGDQLNAQVFQNSGGALSLSASVTQNYILIKRIGN